MSDSAPPADEPQAQSEPQTRRRPSRRTMTLLGVPLAVVTVLSYIGDAIMPGLVDEHPLVLLALNPRNRNLILVTNQLDPWSYYTVGFVRLILTDPLWFLLGYWYGETALRWAERRTRTFGETLRMLERGFGKAAYPLVFVVPNSWICLFAGSAGMSVPVFVALNFGGTIARLYLVRVLGETFEAPIDAVLDFIGEYRLPLLALSVVLVAVMGALEYRKGGGELEGLTHLDEEMAETDAELHHGDPEAR
jgi:membrane protein DedA with SNARE-associated domain